MCWSKRQLCYCSIANISVQVISLIINRLHQWQMYNRGRISHYEVMDIARGCLITFTGSVAGFSLYKCCPLDKIPSTSGCLAWTATSVSWGKEHIQCRLTSQLAIKLLNLTIPLETPHVWQINFCTAHRGTKQQLQLQRKEMTVFVQHTKVLEIYPKLS